MKKDSGFTLVELIVDIAILGILGAVAIPAYTGYITKANEAADITQLDAVKTAAMAYHATTGAVTKIVVDTAKSGLINSVQINDDSSTELATNDTFKTYLTGSASGTLPTLKSDTYKGGATWNGTAWSAS